MCRVSTPPSSSDNEGADAREGSVRAVKRGNRSDKVVLLLTLHLVLQQAALAVRCCPRLGWGCYADKGCVPCWCSIRCAL